MADFEGPLLEFYERINQIRKIVVVVESVSKNPVALVTSRSSIDLAEVGAECENTVNAMSLVFLASSFEEFVREEIGQCADQLALKYVELPDQDKHNVRGAYWTACLERLRFNSSILTKNKPKSPDLSAISKVRALLDSAKAFVVDNDASSLDRSVYYSSSNNFRPHVVDAIANRLGIKSLIEEAADCSKLRLRFGVSTKKALAENLRGRLDEFYDRRNGIVHSLNSTSGYGVNIVIDYTDLFEEVAESIKNVLKKATNRW